VYFTKECDYAVRIVRALAHDEIMSGNQISECELIPLQFAYKILKKLERAGLVSSFRGATGGYRLKKRLKDITLVDIVTAIDEKLYLNECLLPQKVCKRNSDGNVCAVHDELERVQGIVHSALSEKTMDMLV
jgi:Rrf2 family protein